jgi:GNAT superfamily N-acetyltransferase
MSVPIARATPDRVPALAELLGRAFTDDPMLVWPFGAGKTEVVTNFFRAFDEPIATHGWLWEAGTGRGVAAWIPPGSDEAMMEIDRSMRPTLPALETRHADMWEWIAGNFPDEPFWYLDHIGVDAEHRGAGVGTALIQHGLAFAERDGVPAFLETGRSGNVAYYERRGFRTVTDADAPGGGPHIWFMRYDP